MAVGQGEGDPLQLQDVSETSVTSRGAAVVTSGLDVAAYPSGIPVGTVSSVRHTGGSLTSQVLVTPLVNLSGSPVRRRAPVVPTGVRARQSGVGGPTAEGQGRGRHHDDADLGPARAHCSGGGVRPGRRSEPDRDRWRASGRVPAAGDLGRACGRPPTRRRDGLHARARRRCLRADALRPVLAVLCAGGLRRRLGGRDRGQRGRHLASRRPRRCSAGWGGHCSSPGSGP